TDEETQMAIDAAASIGLGVCAVDIIRDSKDNNKPYVIEVNGNGSLNGITKVTGHNVALDIVLYAEKIGKKPVVVSQQNATTPQNKVDWNAINNLPHNKEIDKTNQKTPPIWSKY
ncbi:MAG: hypothetical protein Q8T08_06820, partial [Ignavibacteria bacterium]|nr:hypothetical protein [Ignavibacteria bacterium]